jgi:hypothetical protein
MNKPQIMIYRIKADSKELRDKIRDWSEINIKVSWNFGISTWDPSADDEGKWGLLIDGGTVQIKEKLLSAFQGRAFIIQESDENSAWAMSGDLRNSRS